MRLPSSPLFFRGVWSQSLGGRVSLPVVIFLSACTGSAILFFVITKPMIEASKAAKEQYADAIKGAESVPVPRMLDVLPTPGIPDISQEMNELRYTNPGDLVDFAKARLMEKDFGAVAALTGRNKAGQAEVALSFQKLFGPMGVSVSPDAEAREIGQVGVRRFFALPLRKDGVSEELMLEVWMDPGVRSWRVAEFVVPNRWKAALAKQSSEVMMADGLSVEEGPAGVVSSGAGLTTAGSVLGSLGFTDSFVRALQDRDFGAASAMVDSERVPPEKVAGLCILLEESGYRLAKERPLVETASADGQSLVIARLEGVGREPVEFGVMLTRLDVTKPWKISELNMSNLLAAFLAEKNTEVPYSPIVENPSGGQSIVVYFSYDDSALHERAKRQLGIIAAILKANPARHLDISGYTDALGSDNYNLELSGRRALTVSTELRRLGVPVSQIRAVAKGKENPLSPNTDEAGADDPQGRAKNRRAEIYLNF